jgi:hypothetical protein
MVSIQQVQDCHIHIVLDYNNVSNETTKRIEKLAHENSNPASLSKGYISKRFIRAVGLYRHAYDKIKREFRQYSKEYNGNDRNDPTGQGKGASQPDGASTNNAICKIKYSTTNGGSAMGVCRSRTQRCCPRTDKQDS